MLWDVWESFLSPQDQANPNIVTGPMVIGVCHQGFRGRGCKTSPPGLTLDRRAFNTSCYIVPANTQCGTCCTETKGVSVILVVQEMPACLCLPPEHTCWAHFFLCILLIIFPEMPQSIDWGSVTECFSLLLRHLDDEHSFRIVVLQTGLGLSYLKYQS